MTPAGARVLAALPGSAEDIMLSTALSPAATYRAVGELREAGLAHIASWRDVGVRGRRAAVYAAGAGDDAPAPKPSRPQKNRAAAERRKDARPFGAQTAALQAAFFPAPRT